jgi:putative addiction module killer protein
VKIKEYLTSKGVSPFSKWYKKLGDTLKVKVDARLQRIIITDNFGDSKSVGSGVQELRFMSKSGLRIYYAKDGDELVLLLVGGNKSTQDRDITKAKEYWKDYKARGDDHGK